MKPLVSNSTTDTFDCVQKTDGLYGVMLQALRNVPVERGRGLTDRTPEKVVELAHGALLGAAKEYLADSKDG